VKYWSAIDLGSFRHIRDRYAQHMKCGKDCTACCYGLFVYLIMAPSPSSLPSSPNTIFGNNSPRTRVSGQAGPAGMDPHGTGLRSKLGRCAGPAPILALSLGRLIVTGAPV